VNSKAKNRLRAISLSALILIFLGGILSAQPVSAGNIRVPQDYPTIQAAINAAVSGDIVIVSPGTYNENLVIAGKTITLASLYYTTGDRQYIDSTIINGQQLNPVITIDKTAGQETTIQGLSIVNGTDGLATFTKSNILDNRISGNSDGIDNTNGGGAIRGNIIENNKDDGIDFDKASEGLIENNIIRYNLEDGFEIRLEEYLGTMLNIKIHNNHFIGNSQDGLQLIGSLATTNRVIHIERNLFLNNSRVGIGLLDNLQSGEDYRAASLMEQVNVINNTFSGNNYAITGGDNLAAVNNIFTGSTTMGLKNIDGNSVVANNLFWNNGTDHSGSNVDLSSSLSANPLLGLDFGLQYSSPAIDTGAAQFIFQGSPIFNYLPGTYFGAAPDLGWLESNFLNEPTATITPTITPTSTPRPGDTFIFAPVDDASLYNAYPSNNYGSASTLNVDNSPIQNFLIKFQIDGLGGRSVTRARLRLYNTNESSKGGDFYRVSDQSWTEETVNWNNAPAADSTLVAALDTVAVGNWYDVDLTSFIIGDGYYTLRVSSTSTNGADYSSKEGANPPVLEVVVSNGPTATPGTITPSTTPTITYEPTQTLPPTTTFTPAPSATPLPAGNIRFAVIGDYGDHTQAEADVATLVDSWNPNFVVTVGDNNYPLGAADTIDRNIGQYYQQFISPYLGSYGDGAVVNRFFPALGNHDLDTSSGQPYLDYFTLPGNERYYDFVQGLVHFFVINSDPREPDGVSSTSVQGQWLQAKLATSNSTWQVLIFHHAAYSSGAHGSSTYMRWPFKEWGVDAVLSGHDHTYERLLVNGLPYFVDGLGGNSVYNFTTILPESQVRYNSSPGALLVEANADQLVFKFYSTTSVLIDSYVLNNLLPATQTPTATAAATATLVTPSATPTSTAVPTATVTATLLPTATFTAPSTITPVPTYTSTPTSTATNTLVPTTTFTPTSTATSTLAPITTFIPLPTATNTIPPTNTFIPTATVTQTLAPTSTFTPTATATTSSTPTLVSDLIFTSSFETGSFADWSASVTDAGDLSITNAAAMVDQSGMAALIDDKRAIYVGDASPSSEPRYRARFYFDINAMTLSTTPLTIFYGFTSSSTQVIKIDVRYSGGTYQVRSGLRNDSNTWYTTGWTSIINASHFLEFDWMSATAVGANNGEMTFWVDGIQSARLTGIDNDKRRIDMIRLGVLAGMESTTRGTVNFDAFESRRTSYIGPAAP